MAISGISSVDYNKVFQKVSTEEKSQLIAKKVSDEKVIDLSNPENILKEFTKDKAEFIKVDKEHYLKIDISNPQAARELLQNIKLELQKRGTESVFENFSFEEFTRATEVDSLQAKKQVGFPPAGNQPAEKPAASETSITNKTYENIISLKEQLKTLKPESKEYKKIESELKVQLLETVSPEFREDIGKMLNLPLERQFTHAETKILVDIINKYEKNGNLKDLIQNFDSLGFGKTITGILEHAPVNTETKKAITSVNTSKGQLLPDGINTNPVTINKENPSVEDAIQELDKLGETNKGIGELLNKLKNSKGEGKSLRLTGIGKEDLAIFLATGKYNEKMEKAMEHIQKTGGWPELISILEITKLHRSALQEKVKGIDAEIKNTFEQLSKAKTPEEQSALKNKMFLLVSQKEQVESQIKNDTSTLRKLPDIATRARVNWASINIAKYDAKLSTLDPSGKEYAKIKNLRDKLNQSLEADAKAIDKRIESLEKRGKPLSMHVKSLAANVHTASANSQLGLYHLDSQVNFSSETVPPKNENLVKAEIHISKVEKYTDLPEKNLGLQELKLNLHQSQRKDITNRLKVTGVEYDEKEKVFKYPVPKDYQPSNQSSMVTEAKPQNYSSPDGKVSNTLITAAQQEIEKDYHVAGLDIINDINNQKNILVSQLPAKDSPAPSKSEDVKKYVAIVNKLASLDAVSTGIRIEHEKVLLKDKKADENLSNSASLITERTKKLSDLNDQRSFVSREISETRKHIGELQAELDDWKDNYVFTNPQKQKELQEAIKHGEDYLAVKTREMLNIQEQHSDLDGTGPDKTKSINHSEAKFNEAATVRDITSVQASALINAYKEKGESGNANLRTVVELTRKGIESGEKAFDDQPEWMKSNPEFKEAKARHIYTQSIPQRLELTDAVVQVSVDSAKSGKQKHDIELTSGQSWAKESVRKLTEAEKLRDEINKLPEGKGLQKEEKKELAILSVGTSLNLARNISGTIPEETLNILESCYRTSESQISPADVSSDGKTSLQAELQHQIGMTALSSVTPALRRTLVTESMDNVPGKPQIGAAQNLLDFSKNISVSLISKPGGKAFADEISSVSGKWDNVIKNVQTEIRNQSERLKEEKAQVLSAYDYQAYKTRQAADGHWLAATIWGMRDDGKDPKSEFSYENIDLNKLDSNRKQIEEKFDRNIQQTIAFSDGFASASGKGKALEFISAMKLVSELNDLDNSPVIRTKFSDSKNTAREMLGNYSQDVSRLINPKFILTSDTAKDTWDPTIRTWLAKGGPSPEEGSRFTETANEIRKETGSLVSGGFRNEFAAAQKMEGKYAGMSITDVLGLDTKDLHIDNENFQWLNNVGSFLNRTDTLAMVAEIALVELLTAGAGSGLAFARAAGVFQKIAQFPKIEQAVAMMKAISSFAPAVISGEKTAARAFNLIAEAYKNEKRTVQILAGLRKVEQFAEVGVKSSRMERIISGSVHMGQVMALQNTMNYAAQKAFGEHSLAAKFVEFGGQFMFISSADKFSGIKSIGGRVLFNTLNSFMQQEVGSISNSVMTKIMESATGGPLSAEQNLEIKKWSERMAMAFGIVAPVVHGAFHQPHPTEAQVKELAALHTDLALPGIDKNSPQFKEVHTSIENYIKKTSDPLIPVEKAKAELAALGKKLEGVPGANKEATGKFLGSEALKIAMREIPHIETKDPEKYATHIKTELEKINGKGDMPRISSEAIERIVFEEKVKKTVEGVHVIDVDVKALSDHSSEKSKASAGTEEGKLIKQLKDRQAEITEKLKSLKEFNPETAKELTDLSLKISMEEIIHKKDISKEGIISVLKAAKELNIPELSLRLKIGGETHEFNVKLSKNKFGEDEFTAKFGEHEFKINAKDIEKVTMSKDALEIVTRDTPAEIHETKAEVESFKKLPPEKQVEFLFKDTKLETHEDFKQFIEKNREKVSEFLSKNAESGDLKPMLEFYKKCGSWENVKSLYDKIDPQTFEKIHLARDKALAGAWEKVTQDAKGKIKEKYGFEPEFENPYVGTKPTETGYKKAWSDVDFSVKLKNGEHLSDIDKHIVELTLMKNMQKELQNLFEGAPSTVVDSNAYATPLFMPVGIKGEKLIESNDLAEWKNHREMEFYQIRDGYAHHGTEEGEKAYQIFKKNTLDYAEAKGFRKEVEQDFAKAEERYSKDKADLKKKIEEIRPQHEGKSEHMIEEIALTELRYAKEEKLIDFMKKNKDLLSATGDEGQKKRIEFNQLSREMRTLWPEAYIGDSAAKWGSAGSKMKDVAQGMSQVEKMQYRISQAQFKLHWLFSSHTEKDLAKVVMKAAKYDLRDISFREMQMTHAQGGTPWEFSKLRENESVKQRIDEIKELKKSDPKAASEAEKKLREEVLSGKKVYDTDEIDDKTYPAIREIKDYAKTPEDAAKIWEKYFGSDSKKEMENYLKFTQFTLEFSSAVHLVLQLRDRHADLMSHDFDNK